MFIGGAISWRSSKQKCVALSTAEAEYVALSSAAQESIWLRQLGEELRNSSHEGPIVIYEDNQVSIAMTKNPQFHGRAKYIDIRHFVCEQVSIGKVKLEHFPTSGMTADMLTKGLTQEQFTKLHQKAGVHEMPSH